MLRRQTVEAFERRGGGIARAGLQVPGYLAKGRESGNELPEQGFILMRRADTRGGRVANDQ